MITTTYLVLIVYVRQFQVIFTSELIYPNTFLKYIFQHPPFTER